MNKNTEDVIFQLFETGDKPKINMLQLCKQECGSECGLFAIATATALAFGLNPISFEQSSMRQHLMECFENGIMNTV